jgi:hypothetical protein
MGRPAVQCITPGWITGRGDGTASVEGRWSDGAVTRS